MARDGASVVALEGILVALVVLGAALFLAGGPEPRSSSSGPDWARAARDVLALLETMPGEPPFRSLLQEHATNAMLGDPSGLSSYLRRMLPPMAGWGVYLDNGVRTTTLAEEGARSGPTEAATTLVYAEWSHAMVFATLDHQPGTTSSMDLEIVAVRNSYLDRGATGRAVFENGDSVSLKARRKDGVLVADSVPPEQPGYTGFAVPYDTSSLSAYTKSLSEAKDDPARAFGVATTLPYEVRTPVVYHVHPDYSADPLVKDFLRANPGLRPARGSVEPGGVAVVSYDFSGLPLAAGWTVESITLHLYSPVLARELRADPLPSLEGKWTWQVPANALYGTYVAELRVELVGNGLFQYVHSVTPLDVTRPGAGARTVPVYRLDLVVWPDP